MFLELENNRGKLQIISGKFQNSDKFQNTLSGKKTWGKVTNFRR